MRIERKKRAGEQGREKGDEEVRRGIRKRKGGREKNRGKGSRRSMKRGLKWRGNEWFWDVLFSLPYALPLPSLLLSCPPSPFPFSLPHLPSSSPFSSPFSPHDPLATPTSSLIPLLPSRSPYPFSLPLHLLLCSSWLIKKIQF